jgi:hypothetical protein
LWQQTVILHHNINFRGHLVENISKVNLWRAKRDGVD